MKKLILCMLLFCSAAIAQTTTDVTITVTVPNEVITAVNTWRLKQFQQDGVTLKWPTLKAWLQSALQEEVQSILVEEPTPTIVTEDANIKAAEDAKKAQIDAIVVN